MKVTIVPDDKKIVVDDRLLKSDDFVFAANVHAIQWKGTVGHIEYNDGRKNEAVTSQSEIQDYINQHQTEAQKIDSKPALQPWEEATYTGDGVWNVTYKSGALSLAKQSKTAELTSYAKQYLSDAMSDYSEWEAISWPMLIAEAEQFDIDGTVGEYMTAEIGVKYPTVTDLATVLLQRKTAMKALRAGVILARQTKEAEIEAAQTLEELNVININEGWPS